MSGKQPSVNDYSLAWLRIAVGLLFLIFAQYKVWGVGFVRGSFEASIHQFLRNGAYPFMVPILRDFVLAHAKVIAYLVAYGELCIGLSLLLGILVREASFCGLVYMCTLLLCSDYPGRHAAVWQYFAAALSQLAFALCFVAFGMGDASRVWSVPSHYRRKFARMVSQSTDNQDSSFVASNTFGK